MLTSALRKTSSLETKCHFQNPLHQKAFVNPSLPHCTSFSSAVRSPLFPGANWAEGLVQSVKHMPCKFEDITQKTHTKPDMMQCACHPSARDANRRVPETPWPASLA